MTHSTRALHARIAHTDGASYHTQEALSQRIGPNPAECKRSFHRRFYKEYLHASRLTFNLLLVWG